eukprot:CAMPEP_0202960304 /NCGR_PEP_ID=MMETSP1396-20130829/4451_1 /ASSEMBLY_ACC=CAM_ASM_000872 /TAXON_ID= /ORGANISM="Pseudokeronopsis sp., Strain Brazil" /LENGTH=144 /DNA_ID=CAMNT_0049679435 /DNA_START=166 /DNA_END=600 /DNA_ORIENTATION=-
MMAMNMCLVIQTTINISAYLFSSFASSTKGEYFWMVLLTFLIGMSVEGFSFLRYFTITQSKITEKRKYGIAISRFNIPGKAIPIVVLLYMANVTLAYSLMLVVMTFNLGMLIAACCGLATGYFVFGIFRENQKEYYELHFEEEQ